MSFGATSVKLLCVTKEVTKMMNINIQIKLKLNSNILLLLVGLMHNNPIDYVVI